MPGRPYSRDPVRIQLGYWGYAKVRDRLLQDQGSECYWCLRPVFKDWRDAPDIVSCKAQIATIDHIEALSRGGTWKRYNLCIACKRCNERKGSLDEETFHAMIMDEMETEAA